MDSSEEQRSEIVFFDLETTMPVRPGQGFSILEFGAILVCPRNLEELQSYSTLVRPLDLSLITSLSIRCNGITRDDVLSAPSFSDIADCVFKLLHGRIWAGHNILRFDCRRIREAFADIGMEPPEPIGIIDSLALLTQKFGRRAGDMKMASLATYFGLGVQAHRSLADVRLNLEVVKYCATVLFLESSLPDILAKDGWVSSKMITRSRSTNQGKTPSLTQEKYPMVELPPLGDGEEEKVALELPSFETGEAEETEQFWTPRGGERADGDNHIGYLDMASLTHGLAAAAVSCDDIVTQSEQTSVRPLVQDGEFLEPTEVDVRCIEAVPVPSYPGCTMTRILHKGVVLKLCCPGLTVRLGASGKFVDSVGRPRLGFVVDVSPDLCVVLDSCDDIVRRAVMDGESCPEWRHTVYRKNGYLNSPTMRLNIPFAANGGKDEYKTEIVWKKEEEEEKVEKRGVGVLVPGTILDAFFSLQPYHFLYNAGIRLVATKLLISFYPNS